MRKRLKGVKLSYGLLCICVMAILAVSSKVYATESESIAASNYQVTANVSNITFSGASQATAGNDYVATIKNNGGCQLPPAISVSVGGVTLSSGSSTYTYDVRSGQIVVKGGAVTGNIIISASATAHQWTQNNVVVVGSSCTTQGIQGKYCQVCGMTSSTSGVAPAGHKFENYVSNKDATCSKEGTKTAVCSRPGCTATNTITDTGSKLSHTSTGKRTNVQSATCTEEGYTGDLYCECGAIVRYGTKIPMTEHREIIVGKQNPSCIVEGYTGDSVCLYCNQILAEGTVIKALESHSYGDWTTVLEATSLKIGRRERVCEMCGIKESELIAAGKWNGTLLVVGIILLLVLGMGGVGCCIFFAIKKITEEPAPLNLLEEPAIEEAAEATENVEKTENVSKEVIVATESTSEENL